MSTDAGIPNMRLRQQRMMRGWSQKRLADMLDTSKEVVSRWERGIQHPSPYYQEKLCTIFGQTAEELGFLMPTEQEKLSLSSPPKQFLVQPSLSDTRQDIIEDRGVHKRSGQRTSSADAVNALLDFLADTALQEQSIVDKEHQYINVVRRQILVQLLEAAGITLLSPTLATVANPSSSIAIEEFVLQCASSLKACWHLLKGKGLIITEEILSAYVPSLTTLIQQSSHHIGTLAGFAAQAKILQAVLAMHKLDFLSREKYCYEAVKYGQFSGDKRLHVGALMYLAYTYTYCYPQQPERAVKLFLEGLRILGDKPSILRSDIYIGLADAYAQCKAEQEALETIELAHMHFPDHPELDPSFLYADYGWSEIYQWQGKMYLDLAVHYPHRGYAQKAFDAFSQSIKLQSIAERSTAETIIHQADAARGIGDLDRYVALLTEGAQMARSLESQKRYSEAFDIFRRTPVQWRNEPSIRQLTKEVFREPPRKVKS